MQSVAYVLALVVWRQASSQQPYALLVAALPSYRTAVVQSLYRAEGHGAWLLGATVRGCMHRRRQPPARGSVDLDACSTSQVPVDLPLAVHPRSSTRSSPEQRLHCALLPTAMRTVPSSRLGDDHRGARYANQRGSARTGASRRWCGTRRLKARSF